MADETAIARLLQEVAETQVLGQRPVRSHLVHALVQLDRDYNNDAPNETWGRYYAEQLPALLMF